MTATRVAVLRPEPGNAATAARAAAAGLVPVCLPLFAVRALDWTLPDAAGFDALLLTSANAVRQAGLALPRTLPVWAVGAATAQAARAAGLRVAGTGLRDAAALVADAAAAGVRRALHLGGAETTVMPGGIVAASVPVYASEPVPVAAAALRALAGSVALLHSARAARRWAALVGPAGRGAYAVAAISPAVLAAAGGGWAAAVAAARPDDAALVAAAALIDPAAAAMDKPGA